MGWDFVLTDQYGNNLGEVLDAPQRQVLLPLDRVPTGNFTVRNDNPMLPFLREMDVVLVKAYRNGRLTALGPISPNYHKDVSGQNQTTQFFWSGVGWRLSRRIIEASKSVNGVTYGTAISPMDRAQIAASIINGLNASPLPAGVPATVADTGVRVDPAITNGTLKTTTTYVGPWYYKNALEAIIDLSSTLDGYDWKIIPVEPTADSTGIALGTFTTGAPNLGQQRPNAVFEYGDGKLNVASFTEDGDNSGIMNRGFCLPQNFPDTTSTELPLTQVDTTSMNNRGVVYEDLVQADFSSDDLRNRLIMENVAVRKVPRIIIRFVPSVSSDIPGQQPSYYDDYVEGDVVQFRAVEYGKETINAWFRLFQVQFDIDENGNETPTPTLLSQDIF